MKPIQVLRPIKRNIERALGIRILKKLPRGLDFVEDLKQFFPTQEKIIILDVGANIGQSARPLANVFRSAEIHCFEPSKENYKVLTQEIRGDKNIYAYQFAVGDTSENKLLLLESHPTAHRIIENNQDSGVTELVQTITLDDFCKSHNIDRVNILKIDTEGYDLKVLQGITALLSKGSVDVIHCEAGMSRTNETHVPFGDIHEFLIHYGYFLFGLYEQMWEFKLGKPYLRRTNVTFISPGLSGENQKQPR